MRIALLMIVLEVLALGQQMVLVHGHRGARALRPENTIAAFEYAIGVGVDALELDMAVTKDNVVVVSHDPVLHAPVCRGPRASAAIRELTLAELREWDCGSVPNPGFPKQQPVAGARVPTLDEVFQLAPRGKFDFNIETKIFEKQPQYTPAPEEFARLVLTQIRKHHLESRVIVQSFDYRTLIAMKKLAPEVRRSALMESDDRRDFVAAANDAGGVPIVSPNYRIVTAEKIAAAHAAGLQVVPWTVNTVEDWERMVKCGADALISDDPASLMEWLGRRR